ncbi:SusC/RagA family TonB-linked outer membrane protein [Aquimarina hainanensis]|uniref:SusC/RagA family TonB-linked outer membrane protein n=1 Tax=Aquimarina hainanensis TaxID=1578017 RepID=A0ABW5N9K1_9FLAO
MRTKFSGILTLLLAFVVQLTFAQEKTVTGTVTDNSGLPLPGVNILIKGTNNGTQTDFDGNYSIKANRGAVITFSYIGFTTKEMAIGDNSVISIQLEEDSAELEEVVVMGYSSKRKSEVTGSVVQIKAAEIEQVPVASVDQVLQGKVSGLTISGNSGTPGSVQQIRIRGISSITAGNEPLYVIDGVPMDNIDLADTRGDGGNTAPASSTLSSLSSINSSDIASITVLKDASAIAAYGARGANGVIVITTKSGKTGKTTYTLNSSVGFSNDAVSGPTVLTAAEREQLFYESLYNTFGASEGFSRDQAQAYYEANTNVFGRDYLDWNAAGRPEGNWADVIKNKDAVQSEYNFSVTGGDEKSNFYASLGLFNSEATVIGADFKRISGSLRYSRDLSNKLKFNTKTTVANTEQDGLLEGSAYFGSPRTAKYFMSPLRTPYNSDGTINIDNVGSVRNPLWIAENDISLNKFTRIINNNSITWDTPIENLSFTSRANIDYTVFDRKRYQNRTHGDAEDLGGSASRTTRIITNYVFQNSLNYNFIVNDLHKFDLKLLQEYQENKRNYLNAEGENFAADGLTNLNSAGKPTTADSRFFDWSVASYLGTMSYGYDNKYLLNATYRKEASSRFHESNRWGTFWSLGAAWNVQNESFMTGTEDIINNLKLRASYGISGNANIDLNTYQTLLGYDADYQGSSAVYPSTFGNNSLTWEKSKSFDTGVDFGLFQNRVSGSFSYYRRESTDLLQEVPLSRTTGFGIQNQNIGRMENKGFEVELNVEIVRSDDFNLSIGGNLSTNKNEVLELATDGNGEEISISTGTRRVQSGHTVWEWYMRKFAGVDTNTGENLYYLNGTDGETTTNYNEAERAFQGTGALPTLTAGANIHIDYKGFFLDANAYYAGGHQVYEDWARYTNGNDRFSLQFYNGINTVLDRWQEPGDVTEVSKVTYTAEPWRTHTRFLHDGDFIRLKNITLGYNFQNKHLDLVGLASARIFVRGTNVFTWVKDSGLKYDPEVQANGFTSLTTPPTKTYSLGVNLKF